MSTVIDHHGNQVWPPREYGDRGNGWHLHMACDADLRSRSATVALLAETITITEDVAA